MEINKTLDGQTLVLALSGRLDTTTAPQLENEMNASIENVTSLIYDFSELDYVSSAGLRVLLASQKIMNQKGTMVVKNVKPEIMEVFELTGFTDILTIE